MKQIPLCHKCNSAIIEFSEFFQHSTLTGCKECDTIKSYADAKEQCPLLKETNNDC